jgi:hypothetical protein
MTHPGDVCKSCRRMAKELREGGGKNQGFTQGFALRGGATACARVCAAPRCTTLRDGATACARVCAAPRCTTLRDGATACARVCAAPRCTTLRDGATACARVCAAPRCTTEASVLEGVEEEGANDCGVAKVKREGAGVVQRGGAVDATL